MITDHSDQPWKRGRGLRGSTWEVRIFVEAEYFTVSAIVGHCKCCTKLFAASAPPELKDRDNIPLLLEDKK
jgi:hypothetical protein